MKLIVLDRDDEAAVTSSVFRFLRYDEPARLREDITQSIKNFRTLVKGVDAIADLRLLPVLPPYGIWWIDAGSPDAEIYVEIYPFRSGREPTFHLISNQDREWFAFFESQFQGMWNAARPLEPDNEQQFGSLA